MRKIIIGLSGGVDSAVAAALLKKEYEVYGLYLDIGVPGGAEDAHRTARALGISLATRDISARLETLVCAPFVSAYLNGETPNPCVICNPLVKLAALEEYAAQRGADRIATGHYARVADGRLYMGRPDNDQSYMLCRLTGGQLKNLVLPLGGMTKAQVRETAASLGLAVAEKPASMEICFVPDGDYASYIEARGSVPPPGCFVDGNGAVLGQHRGIHRYTPGQRRGLGIAAGERLFVTRIDAARNEVVLSPGGAALTDKLTAADMLWHGRIPTEPFRAAVRVRHSRVVYPATVTPRGSAADVLLDVSIRAAARGQAAVFYDGELVVGGGFIA